MSRTDSDAWHFLPGPADFARRVGQCLTWCKANHPCGLQVKLRVVDKLLHDDGRPYFGDTSPDEKNSGSLIIQVSRQQLMREAYDTLIHEWCHVLTWLTIPSWRDEDNEAFHHDYFWQTYGRVLNHWNYHGGRAASTLLEPTPLEVSDEG